MGVAEILRFPGVRVFRKREGDDGMRWYLLPDGRVWFLAESDRVERSTHHPASIVAVLEEVPGVVL